MVVRRARVRRRAKNVEFALDSRRVEYGSR